MNILLLGGIVGFIVAVSIGANDVANSMATAVGARAINIKQAVIIAAILEFAGAAIFGAHVTETIRKGIVDPAKVNDPNAFMLGAFSALIATAIWIFIATYFGLPVSTTHSIVGAMAGFGIAVAGWSVVRLAQNTYNNHKLDFIACCRSAGIFCCVQADIISDSTLG
ncbi:MAG: inorganic phosphate transporter, PiT family [Thermotogaceae bacterium]|nr:inorganic phosphate transporter, PiT family [Thermotogaceae bacterium]